MWLLGLLWVMRSIHNHFREGLQQFVVCLIDRELEDKTGLVNHFCEIFSYLTAVFFNVASIVVLVGNNNRT